MDIMIDIETLSTSLGAAILSVGAVRFDPWSDRLTDPFSLRFPLQEQIDGGARIDADTLWWWMEQKPEVRSAAFRGAGASSVTAGLAKLTRYLQRGESSRLWSNGPSFDSAQLQLLYQRSQMPWPLRYNADRDCRTLFWLAFPEDGRVPVDAQGDAHNALQDAKWQARAVQCCFRRIRVEQGSPEEERDGKAI